MNRMPKCHPSFAQYAALDQGLLNISIESAYLWATFQHVTS